MGLRALLKGPTAVQILLWPHQGLKYRPCGSKSSSLTTTLQAAQVILADALNGYFVESFTRKEVTNRLDGILNTLRQNVFGNIEIGDREILDKLQKLKTNKAAGPDGIFQGYFKS